MVLKMAIADTDRVYVSRLTNAFVEYKDVNISAYTDSESLKEAMNTRKFDMLLIDASVCHENLDVSRAALCVMLVGEEQAAGFEKYGNLPKIKKYQRISSIYQQMMELFADVCGNTDTYSGGRGAEAIAFYSPVGGAGKTTLALVTATKLAFMGYRVFYLNLEDVASEACYLPQSDGKGMSELLSCIGTGTNFGVKMQGLMQKKQENMFYINHFDTPNDVYEMQKDEISELLSKINRSGLFDYLIIDMGISMDEKAQQVFRDVDKIVIVEKPDQIAVQKLNCFYSQIFLMNEFREKMVRILNFDLGELADFQTSIPRIGRISRAQNPDSAQFIGMLADSFTCNFVQELIQ